MEKNMKENFEKIESRVFYSLYNTDLERINYELSKITEPTLISGVGGSSVVSEFGAKVINFKNDIVSVNSEPRDLLYRNNKPFKNVVSCSYSGNNYGEKLSFSGSLKKYLLSNNSFGDSNVTYLKYNTSIEKENSFISLGATLIPVSILLNYYLDGEINLILDCIEKTTFNFNLVGNIYEIYSGYDTSTASKYLESTMVESGMGIPIVHDKYSFCHGRGNFGYNYKGTAIYYNKNTEFDKMMLEEFKNNIKENKFIEYAKYNGNYYGTLKDKVNEHLSNGIDVILVIEVQGALEIKHKIPESIFIFIMPPTMKELILRLKKRGTESHDVIIERFKKAYKEINELNKYNYVVVNDEIDKATRKVNAILEAQKCMVERIEEVYLNNPEEEIHELLIDDKDFDNNELNV